MLFKGFVKLRNGAFKQNIVKPLGLGLSMGKLACFCSSLHIKTFTNLLMISLEVPYSHSTATKEIGLALNYLVMLIAENVFV